MTIAPNPIIVITQVDASGIGLRGEGVKTGARSNSGPGSSRRVIGVGGGATGSGNIDRRRQDDNWRRWNVGRRPERQLPAPERQLPAPERRSAAMRQPARQLSASQQASPAGLYQQSRRPPKPPPHCSRAIKAPCDSVFPVAVGVDEEVTD